MTANTTPAGGPTLEYRCHSPRIFHSQQNSAGGFSCFPVVRTLKTTPHLGKCHLRHWTRKLSSTRSRQRHRHLPPLPNLSLDSILTPAENLPFRAAAAGACCRAIYVIPAEWRRTPRGVCATAHQLWYEWAPGYTSKGYHSASTTLCDFVLVFMYWKWLHLCLHWVLLVGSYLQKNIIISSWSYSDSATVIFYCEYWVFEVLSWKVVISEILHCLLEKSSFLFISSLNMFLFEANLPLC